MKKAILYTRVSTDEQAEKGYSLYEQKETLQRYCLSKGYEIVDIITEDHSAKDFNRPEFNRLLSNLKRKHMAELLLFVKWDRFSRNAPEAYAMINTLNKLGIEPQATEQPLDLNVPENKLILAIYLTAPEVENDRRALNTLLGMRRAKKMGRWMSTAPKGYKNVRDENNRPIIAPSKDALLVKEAFTELSKGVLAIEDVRKKLLKKGLKTSRANFHVMMHNPLYCGLITIPPYKDEPAEIVQGLHEPIISKTLFYDVQDVLLGRKRVTASKITKKEELPLRGFLICPQCGYNLTGSASRGNGGKYFYYHCMNGCKERVKADTVNNIFSEALELLCSKPGIIDYYEKAVADLFKNNSKERNQSKDKIQLEIDKCNKRIQEARRLLLDGLIDANDFKEIKEEYQPIINKLSREQAINSEVESDYKEYVKFGFSLLRNFDKHYSNADIEVKQLLIGSMFPEKLTFEKNQLRTTALHPAMALITSGIKGLKENKKGLVLNFSNQSCMVARTRIELVSHP